MDNRNKGSRPPLRRNSAGAVMPSLHPDGWIVLVHVVIFTPTEDPYDEDVDVRNVFLSRHASCENDETSILAELCEFSGRAASASSMGEMASFETNEKHGILEARLFILDQPLSGHPPGWLLFEEGVSHREIIRISTESSSLSLETHPPATNRKARAL